jgi:NADP-dependent 3-hydroxy acid dehydrogenase YdfG
MLDLIVITGATRGIGRSIVDKCQSLCRNMIVIGSSNKVNFISSNNCNIHPLQLDLTDYKYAETIISNYLLDFKIKTLGMVLCAGQTNFGGLLQSNLEDWDRLYKCNVLGNLAIIKSCLTLNPNKLRIVLFAGGGSAYGYPEFSAYALSKVAIVREAENLSMELNNLDSSIIALAPGAVDTDMLKEVIAHGGIVKTKTDISEPTNFVKKFLNDEFDSKMLNGRFIHVRDDLENITGDTFKLRRIQ